MAFAFLGGNAKRAGTSKTSGTTVSTTTAPLSAIPSGSLLIVAIGKDNVSTTDGNTSEVTSVSDDVGGNTYTKLREFCNSNGAANGGATISLWYSILTNGIPASTGVITATLSSAVTAKAIAAAGFSMGAGNTISVVGSSDVAVDASSGLGSPSVTGLPSAEHLWVIGDAFETNTSDSPTATSFTLLSNPTTSGGGAASNMGVALLYDIETGTGNSPTTSGGQSCDKAVTMVAIVEVASTPPVSMPPFAGALATTPRIMKPQRRIIFTM